MKQDKMDMKIGDTCRIQCRYCKIKTNHRLLFLSLNSSPLESDDSENWNTNSQVFMCLGCNEVCLVVNSGLDSDRHPVTGEYEFFEEIYPNPSETRVELKNSFHIPNIIVEVYKETIRAINNRLLILGAIGIGVTIEGICLDKKINGRSLKIKIDNLLKNGFITPDGAKLLHIAREIRNTSAHESKKFELSQVEICVDILENLLINIYILPKVANQIEVAGE